jgi:hypothetical protein
MRIRALVKTHNPAMVNPMLEDTSKRLRFLGSMRGQLLICTRSCCKAGWFCNGYVDCCKIDGEGSHVVIVGAGGCVRTSSGSHPLLCGSECAAWPACKSPAPVPGVCSLEAYSACSWWAGIRSCDLLISIDSLPGVVDMPQRGQFPCVRVGESGNPQCIHFIRMVLINMICSFLLIHDG